MGSPSEDAGVGSKMLAWPPVCSHRRLALVGRQVAEYFAQAVGRWNSKLRASINVVFPSPAGLDMLDTHRAACLRKHSFLALLCLPETAHDVQLLRASPSRSQRLRLTLGLCHQKWETSLGMHQASHRRVARRLQIAASCSVRV